MTAPVDRKSYFRAIEEEFVRRRGAPMLLSPRDWSLIEAWRGGGVPLRLVLQGIANVFDSFESRTPGSRRINSLAYCRQEVETLFQLYRTLRAAEAGAPADGSGEPPGRIMARHLGRLARRLKEAMAVASEAGHDVLVGTLASAAAELKRLRRDARSGAATPPEVEESLRGFDASVVEGARRSLSEEESAQMTSEIERGLESGTGRMTSEAYAATRSAAEAAILRRIRRIPRLTLFD